VKFLSSLGAENLMHFHRLVNKISSSDERGLADERGVCR